MFFKCDGQDLKDVQETFNLTEKETKLIYNAKTGECLLSAGIRKIYAILYLDTQELEKIDRKFVKVQKYA